MAEETNKETIAGMDREEKAADAGQETEAASGQETEAADAAPGQEETAQGEEAQNPDQPEEDSQDGEEQTDGPGREEGAEDDDEVMDGAFTKAPESGKKSSFFHKKKDKKDEKIEELTDRVKRQMAEFDNFRKRTEREKSQMFDLGAKHVIEKILPVIDNFERGLAQASDQEDPFVQGMEKVYKSMLQELESIGVKPIEAEGKEFDPNLHNAVMHVEDESVGENIVVQELQKGYTYHDAVVRHSMVKVAN